MSTTQPSPEYVVRAVRPDDPDEVDRFYEVCLRTAASGADATSLFADGRLPGDIFVRPYLRYAHDLDWVLARPGQLASGYILGTADTIAFEQTLDQEWWSNSENNSAAGQHRRARRTSEPETGSPTPHRPTRSGIEVSRPSPHRPTPRSTGPRQRRPAHPDSAGSATRPKSSRRPPRRRQRQRPCNWLLPTPRLPPARRRPRCFPSRDETRGDTTPSATHLTAQQGKQRAMTVSAVASHPETGLSRRLCT